MQKKPPNRRWDWHVPLLGFLGLLLWTTNRRRKKPSFEVRGEGDLQAMVPTFVGLTEGALDHGNRAEIIQNGAFFDRLLEDVAASKSSIHIESFIWWTGDVCDQLAAALAAASKRGVEVRLMVDYSGSTKMEHDVLAESFAALGALTMDEAGDVEVERLLLAPATVGDEERAAAHHRDEAEEVEPRDRPDVLAERAGQAVLRERSDRDRVVDPEERARAR